MIIMINICLWSSLLAEADSSGTNTEATSSHAAIKEFKKGCLFEKIGNYDKAFASFKVSANLKYIDAYGKLSLYYMIGKGTLANYSKALYWLERGASEGDPLAQFVLYFYYTAYGCHAVYGSPCTVGRWGHIGACGTMRVTLPRCEGTHMVMVTELQCYYSCGESWPVVRLYSPLFSENKRGVFDIAKGISWLIKSSESGFCAATIALSIHYHNGGIIRKDIPAAKALLKKAYVSCKNRSAVETLWEAYGFHKGTDVLLYKGK